MKTRLLSALLAALMIVSMVAFPVAAETVATADGKLVGTVYAASTPGCEWNDPYNDVTRATDDDVNTQWKCVGQNSYTARCQYFGYYYAGGAAIDSVTVKGAGYRSVAEAGDEFVGGVRVEVSNDAQNWFTIWTDDEAAYKGQSVTIDASNWDTAIMTDDATWKYVRYAYGYGANNGQGGADANGNNYCGWDMLQVYDFQVKGEYVVPADALVDVTKIDAPVSTTFGVRGNLLENAYVMQNDGLNGIGFILKVEGLGDKAATAYGIEPVVSATVDEAVKTYSLGWHGNWVWGSCNKIEFKGDGYYMYYFPFNALANDLNMTSVAGDTTISALNIFRSDMAFNVLGVSDVIEGATVSLVGICENAAPAGSVFVKDADGSLLALGSTAQALDTSWINSGKAWVNKLTTVDSIYAGNGAAPLGYGIDKYVDAAGNEYATDDYILGTVTLNAVYGERDVVKYTASVSELKGGEEATITVKVDDPALASAGKVTVSYDKTAFICDNNVIEYTEIAEDGTIGTIKIKVNALAPTAEYTFALAAEATTAKGDVIAQYENATVAYTSAQQPGLFFNGDVVAINKTTVAEDGTVTLPKGQALWKGSVDTTVDGAAAYAVTFIFKLDGIVDPIIANAFNFNFNGSGWTWNSWNWQNTGNTGGKCCANMTFDENGYFYLNVNNIPNGGIKYSTVNSFYIFGENSSAGCDATLRTNTNENATFQMLGIVADNLQPTVKFLNADGSVLAEYTHKYTNYSGDRWAWYNMGKLLSADEAYALAGGVAPTIPNNEDGTPNVFVGWVDADGNPVDAIYYTQNIYAKYTSAYVEYDAEVAVDGDKATLIITADGSAVEDVISGTINVAIDENTFASDLAVNGVISVDYDFTPAVDEVEPAVLDSDILATIVLDIKDLAITGNYDVEITGTAKNADGADVFVMPTTATIAVKGQDVTGAFVGGDKVVINSAAEGSAPATQTVWQGNVNLGGADIATFVFKIEGVVTPMDVTQYAPIVNGKHTLGVDGNTWLWDNHWGADAKDENGIAANGFAAGMKIDADGTYYVSIARRYIANDGTTKYNTVNGFKLFQTPTTMSTDSALVNYSATNTNENATFEMLAILAGDLTPTVNFYNGDELVGSYEYKYSALTGYADGNGANTKMKSFGTLASAADVFDAAALETPHKASDDSYVYVFAGWVDANGNAVDAIYYDMDVYAKYDAIEKTNKIPVEFYNEGELFATEEVYENETLAGPAETPAKAETATGKFVFKGWALEADGEVIDLSKYLVTEAVSLYAIYEYVDVTFNVTYVNGDKTVYTESVIRSTDAAYATVPTKATDVYDEAIGGGYKYTFAFWGVESVDEETGEVTWVPADLTNVQADITVVAVYDATLVEEWFTVTWVDVDGTVLSTHKVATGEDASTSIKGALDKTADENVWYTFAGWDIETTAVTSDLTVTATYTTTPVATGANTVIAEGEGTVGVENELVKTDAPYTFVGTTPYMTLIFDIKGATADNAITIGGIRTQLTNGGTTIDSNNSGNYNATAPAIDGITADGKYFVTFGFYNLSWVGSNYEIVKELTIDDAGSTRGGKSSGEATYNVTVIEGKLEPTVRFYDAEGNWIFTGKYTDKKAGQWSHTFAAVPTAADIYAGAEIEGFIEWVDADGNAVTYVTENMDVYAKVAHVHKYVATGEGTAECACGTTLTDAATIIAQPGNFADIKAGDEFVVSVMVSNISFVGVTFDVIVDGATLAGVDTVGTYFDGYTAEYADGRVVLNAANGGADITPEAGCQIVNLVLVADKDMTAEDVVTVKVDAVQMVNIADEELVVYSGYTAEFTFEVTAADILYGDVDGDGEITGTDATLLTRYANKWDASTFAALVNIEAGDVDGDGEITGTDATLLTRYANKWDASSYADAINLVK